MKKRFLSILLIFCMVLTLFPAAAIADEMPERIDITITGYELGNTPNDCQITVTSTPSAITFEPNSDTVTWWDNGVQMTHEYIITEPFKAERTYSVDIQLNSNGLTSIPNVVVKDNTASPYVVMKDGLICISLSFEKLEEPNKQYTVTYVPGEEGVGKTKTDTKKHNEDLTLLGRTFTREGYIQSHWTDGNGGYYALGGVYTTDADVTLYPVWDKIITVEVPFTTTVKQGGNVAPGETTFELKVVDTNADKEEYAEDYVEAYEADYSAVTISGSVTTNGVGDYKSNMTFIGPSQQIRMMLDRGVYVQQVDAGEEGWTYDQTVFFLRNAPVAYAANDDVATDDAVADFGVLIFPAICEETDDGMYYAPNWYAGPLEKMHFTNIYTKTITESDGNGSGESGGSGGSSGGTSTPPGSGQLEETEPPEAD